MNMMESSFLCLDLGALAVRAMGVHIKSGRIVRSAVKICESDDTIFALKTAVDELESELGKHLDAAYVTGDFGPTDSRLASRTTHWAGEHKIAPADIFKQISDSLADADGTDAMPLHIIPMRYDLGAFKNIKNPVGQIDRTLSSVFHIVSYAGGDIGRVQNTLRAAHIESCGFYDPAFLVGQMNRQSNTPTIFLDMGGATTTVSLWTSRGMISLAKIPMGQSGVTGAISDKLNLSFADAERIKKDHFAATAADMDRFTVADTTHELSVADIIDAGLPALRDILDVVMDNVRPFMEKNAPADLYLYGGGAAIAGIDDLVGDIFKLAVHNLGPNVAVESCTKMVWTNMAKRAARYIARHNRLTGMFAIAPRLFKIKPRRKKQQFIPIMPSTLAFNMTGPATYKMFDSASISMIHCDVMDGFYVDRITGGIEELKRIRSSTSAHLYVHLMTENPIVWADQAAAAGADTIVISTGTNGARAALKHIRELGKRCGIALHPDAPLEILKPVLKEVDDVLIMSVAPGSGGQKFRTDAPYRISTLANTRRRYGLGFKIAVDGGINADTARWCWAAGADYLVAGSYLANADDFPLAVQSLLPRN